MEEIVALYDEEGRPCGSAPRSRMRAENLRHAATAVVVRDSLGRVYVHRRTDTKDVYPGCYDFAAGGVLLAGEDPDVAAAREAEEELGVTSALVRLGEGDYADDHTRYHAFLYETTWDGPVRWQPEEVASGEWVTLERLAALIDDPEVPVMPDTAALLAGWLSGRLADVAHPDQGWDSVTTLVEGRWVDRVPRRPQVAERLLAETRLLPRLTARLDPELGIRVPEPVVLEADPLRVRHPVVPGRPSEPAALSAVDGARLGAFLRALHRTPPDVYADTGVPDADTALASLAETLADMRSRVLPLLPAGRGPAAEGLLAAAGAPYDPCLVHGDLGPEHLLADDSGLTGVIDWSDAVVGDPAVDLAWPLHGTPSPFADAVAAAYGANEELVRGAHRWHRLGPWWEVLAGLDHLGPSVVESGLAGVLARL